MNRGDYRATYSVIVDSDEYKALSKNGKLLFWAVKHSLGPSGIDVLFDDQLIERAGIYPDELELARQELIDGLWIEVEGRIHWLRNGLRFEPNITLTHAKQRAGIERHLKGLPKASIVNRMATYYNLEPPFSPTLSDGSGKGQERLSGPSRFKEKEREPLKEPLKEKGTGKGEGVARAGEASPEANPERPDFDGFNPTDDQRARAAELQVEIEPTLRKWRANRKANGLAPVDLVADFDYWLENEPGYANGNGHGAGGGPGAGEPPARVTPPVYRPPDESDAMPPSQAIDLIGSLKQSLKSDPTPEPRKRHEPLSREQQLAIAKSGKIPEAK